MQNHNENEVTENTNNDAQTATDAAIDPTSPATEGGDDEGDGE